MFSNQIPGISRILRERGFVRLNGRVRMMYRIFYPQPKEQPQGWGLRFMLTIHEAATGRGKNTAWWAGDLVYRVLVGEGECCCC